MVVDIASIGDALPSRIVDHTCGGSSSVGPFDKRACLSPTAGAWITRLSSRVSSRLFRIAHDTVVGACLASEFG